MIRIYSVEHCPFCNELKGMLINDGIDFIDIDVNKPENEAEFNKLYQLTKCDDVPMVGINNQIFVPNVSFRSIKELFGLIKRFLG